MFQVAPSLLAYCFQFGRYASMFGFQYGFASAVIFNAIAPHEELADRVFGGIQTFIYVEDAVAYPLEGQGVGASLVNRRRVITSHVVSSVKPRYSKGLTAKGCFHHLPG